MSSPVVSAPQEVRPGGDTPVRRAKLHINLGSNLLGFAVQAVTTFALTPIILGGLGPYEYGLWSIIVGLTGYYGLFDLGLRAGLTQYLTRHLATDDVDGLNRTLSTGVLAMSSIGIAAALLGAAFAYYAPGHFGLPESGANAPLTFCEHCVFCMRMSELDDLTRPRERSDFEWEREADGGDLPPDFS